ncbi:dnaJ homolog subfamily C member 25 homolog [Drosophila tropicalis]|uniref:dnaJ homolog subfamily C member 25 homolog n=1 Tax=Drosophila tropicalis TaxID=46794 RepID=UPI0035AB9326
MFRAMQMTINSARCLAFYPDRLAHMRQGACYKENYYDVLNIPRNSYNQEIKRAFIELSKKYHPDVLHKEPLRSQYDSHHKMNSPAVDTSYSFVNVHKNWQQYQAAMRKKQQGCSIQIKRPEKSPVVQNKQASSFVPLLPGVTQSHRENFCGSPDFSDTGGDDTEMPSAWMYSCYIAGFGLVSGLLFMDSLSDWCYKEPPECPKRGAL